MKAVTEEYTIISCSECDTDLDCCDKCNESFLDEGEAIFCVKEKHYCKNCKPSKGRKK